MTPAEDPNPPRFICRKFLSELGCIYGSKCIGHHPVTSTTASSGSGQALPSSQSTTTTPSAVKTADPANLGASDVKPADSVPSASTNHDSNQVAPSSTPVPSLTSVSTDKSNPDNLGDLSSMNITEPNDSTDLVRSTTQGTNSIDNTYETQLPPTPEDEPTIPLNAAPIDSSSNHEFESEAPSIDLVPLPNQLPDLSVDETSTADKQVSEVELPTDTQATNGLSRVVINWSATTVARNLEMSGPGMYERRICYSEILCKWSQERGVPATAMINTLMNLVLTSGEVVCHPIYRDTGLEHSLRIIFRHRHEAAAASAALNGRYIQTGPHMGIQTSVSHQITVTYMVPGYIIESLGRHGQGELYMLFERNSCHLHWNNFHFYELDGERISEIMIMGMCEKQVAQCKAVLEDLLRGRVLTCKEDDNRPLWHKIFETEEGITWLREATVDVFDLRVRAFIMASLKVLIVYGSSEWSRREFGGIVERKIGELMERDARAAALANAAGSAELKANIWSGEEWSV